MSRRATPGAEILRDSDCDILFSLVFGQKEKFFGKEGTGEFSEDVLRLITA